MFISLKHIIHIALLLIFMSSSAFLSPLSPAKLKFFESVFLQQYDSLTNFTANPFAIIGQNLIVPDISDSLKTTKGYKGFYACVSEKQVYAPDPQIPEATQYEMLKKKHLKVCDVLQIDDNYYLKLLNFNKDTLFYRYPKSEDEWIFTIEGYYEKLDAQLEGTAFIARKDMQLTDFKENTPLLIKKGEKLVVKNLFVRRPDNLNLSTICVILMLPNIQHVLIPFNCLDIKTKECAFDDLERFAIWSGYFRDVNVRKQNWAYIVEQKLIEGMRPIECELAWGTPLRVTASVNQQEHNEWWFYSNAKLLFTNGELSEIVNN